MKMFGYPLVHRLDKETSGVLMLSKDEDFLKKVISEFRSRRVYKEYIAVVEGIIPEETTISKKIKIIKGNSAKAIIDKNGEEAITHIVPIEVFASKTKLKVDIITGKTHQIRVHLKSIAHPIVGDTLYGGKEEKRILLHSHIVKLFDYEFVSPEPKEFQL
jgi:23S rRNA pseudouridine1911/1915/1917 synthase